MTRTNTIHVTFQSVLWGFTALAVTALLSTAVIVPLAVPGAAPAASAVSADRIASPAITSFERVPFITADGSSTTLAALNGQVRIVTTFYAHCPGTCPLAFDALKRLEGQLTSAQRQGLRVVALTLDPGRDTQSVLREFAQERGFDSGRWVLGRASSTGTEALATQMGVSYRILDDGSVDHTSTFVLLDTRGNVIARTSNTSSNDTTFAAAVRAALGEK